MPLLLPFVMTLCVVGHVLRQWHHHDWFLIGSMHMQMANASLPIAKKYPLFLTADDIKGLEGLSVYMKEESGYAEIQKTKPDTIGFALNDSPAGEGLLLFRLCKPMFDPCNPKPMPGQLCDSALGTGKSWHVNK